MRIPLRNKVNVKLLDLARGVNQLGKYYELVENSSTYSAAQIDSYQKNKFKEIFSFHYENNLEYRKYLKSKGYIHSDNFEINSIPFISKDFFKKNPETCYNKAFVNITKFSGGSTGSPLAVHISDEAIEHFWPSIWRAFSSQGVLPCDKIMMIAGTSLFNNRSFKRKIYEKINRFTVVSSYDLSDDVLLKAYRDIKEKNIKAIYGYTSSVLYFLQFLERKKFKINLKAIFTTSETFIPAVRPLALEYCNCDVIDTYGANDGGIQSYECKYHEGYHINFERCYVEIIDGEIVLTDLLNKAAPFIRYKVGDFTSTEGLVKSKCKCSSNLFRISHISGRVNQFIIDLDGSKIHTEFFSHMFRYDLDILRYQVVQSKNQLTINIVHKSKKTELEFINEYFSRVKEKIKMPFEIVFNKEVEVLSNMKAPTFINHDS